MINNFLLEQKLKDEEIESLELFVKSNPEARELKRALSIKMAIQGHPHNFISQLLVVCQVRIDG